MPGFYRRRSARELAAAARRTGAGGRVLDLRSYRAPAVTCAATRCGARVEKGQIFCRDHWFSLPKGLRTSLWTTFRHRLAQDYGALVRRAIDMIDERGAA